MMVSLVSCQRDFIGIGGRLSTNDVLVLKMRMSH
jgi:hypothetical protein